MQLTLFLQYLQAAFAGAGIGLFYFGGLWLTLKRLTGAKNPALLMYSSFVLRTFASLILFYLISGGKWQYLASALLGFILMRSAISRKVKSGILKPEGKSP